MDTTPPVEPPDHSPIRGEVRRADFRRVGHGLFLPMVPGLDEDQEFRRELKAWLLVLPPEAVFTHVTAARLLGWQLPALPEQVPVFAAVRTDESRPRRPGLICSRLVRPHDPGDVGLPVDRPEEILLRIFHDCLEVDVEPQAVLLDADGRVLGRADLLVKGTKRLHEYDGAGHRDGTQHRTDLRRERGLAGSGYERRGFTLDDLLNHALVVMHEIDRELDRPHRLARLTRWRRLVENSLYSEVGRQRVLNRWRRQMGVVDWSRTA